MAVEIITREDLEVFRKSLLADIKALISEKTEDQKEWLRCADVRKLLKISTGTIQSLRISGKLKSRKVGGIHFYKYADIEQMISGNS